MGVSQLQNYLSGTEIQQLGDSAEHLSQERQQELINKLQQILKELQASSSSTLVTELDFVEHTLALQALRTHLRDCIPPKSLIYQIAHEFQSF